MSKCDLKNMESMTCRFCVKRLTRKYGEQWNHNCKMEAQVLAEEAEYAARNKPHD